MVRLAFTLVLLWLGVATPAQAFEFQFKGDPFRLKFSEYAVAAYHIDNGSIAPPDSVAYDPTGSGYFDWLNRFQVDASWRKFSLLVRFDSSLFLNAPVAAPGDVRFERLLANRYSNRFEFEKATLSWRTDAFDLTLGDVYATYGRGLVLALRKVDWLSIDTSVRGASVTARIQDFSVNVLGGFSNIVNVDTATGRGAADPFDFILGSRADYRFGTRLQTGLNVAWVRFARNAQTEVSQPFPDQTLSGSVTLEAPSLWGKGTAFAEYARQRRWVSGLSYDSGALYLTTTLTFGPVTLQGEFKDYRAFYPVATSLDSTSVPELALINSYTAPPTVERVEQPVKNNIDVTGARLRVDLAVTPTIIPFVALAGFDDRLYSDWVLDASGGLEALWQDSRSRAVVSSGYRPGFKKRTGALDSTVWHAKYLVSQVLTGPYSLELSGLHLGHDDVVGVERQLWNEGQAYLSFKSGNGWSIAAGYEYYTQAPETVRAHYFNGNVSVRVAQFLTLRAFGGGQRGGIKCVNGICRTYPAFSGFRLEVIATY